MSHIHFVGGEKGGVGKSVVARLLAQWWIDRGAAFAGIDGDPSSGPLSRYYGDFTQPADLSSWESADQIIDRALGADRRVLVDLPAQSARALHAWMESSNVLGFARDMGVGVSFFHVTDGGFASVAEIERALSVLGDRVAHVVVKNHGRSKDFRMFDDSDARRQLDALSGRIVEIPELDAATMYSIDRSGSSFWAASHVSDGERALKPLERQRAKLWLEKCHAAFGALGDL